MNFDKTTCLSIKLLTCDYSEVENSHSSRHSQVRDQYEYPNHKTSDKLSP